MHLWWSSRYLTHTPSGGSIAFWHLPPGGRTLTSRRKSVLGNLVITLYLLACQVRVTAAELSSCMKVEVAITGYTITVSENYATDLVFTRMPGEDVPLVEFVYLVFTTRMPPGELP